MQGTKEFRTERLYLRKYKPEDHDRIDEICIETAREGLKTTPEMVEALTIVFSHYYTEQEPENVFVAVDDEVIMAAGAFVQGSSIELSADGPIRPPYAVYFQGGLTWYHAKLGILRSLEEMVKAGLVSREKL